MFDMSHCHMFDMSHCHMFYMSHCGILHRTLNDFDIEQYVVKSPQGVDLGNLWGVGDSDCETISTSALNK